ncbi:hypothetical protein Tco_0205184 [Tanacetum coccineum]
MLLYKKEEKGGQLSVEENDWLIDSDGEPKDQELEAHYIYMAKIKEVFGMERHGNERMCDKNAQVNAPDDSYDVVRSLELHRNPFSTRPKMSSQIRNYVIVDSLGLRRNYVKLLK